MKEKFRHIVVFKPKDDTQNELILNTLRKLAEETAQLLEAKVEESLDIRKGKLIIENFLFQNEADFLRFKKSRAHQDAGIVLKDLCDWQVVDYFE